MTHAARAIAVGFTGKTVLHPDFDTTDEVFSGQAEVRYLYESVHSHPGELHPPMFITRHSPVIDNSLRDQLWDLYKRAYVQSVEMTVTHEMLDRLEFDDQMLDVTNRAWVVWDDTSPIAMTLVATDVRRTRWLSEHYFKTHFSRQFERGQVHYVVWAVVDPGFVARGASIFMARHAMAVEAREGSLLVFDLPESNQPNADGGAAELMLRMARMVGEAELITLTTQRYYALDFAPMGSSVQEHRDDVIILR